MPGHEISIAFAARAALRGHGGTDQRVWAGPPQVAPPPPVTIPISKPIVRPVTEFVDFTGRTEAIQSVDIRPRPTGYLVEMPFQEGAEVKEGDLLFVIDPRPYKAQLDQAVGQVNLYQAQLKLAKTVLGAATQVVLASLSWASSLTCPMACSSCGSGRGSITKRRSPSLDLGTFLKRHLHPR